MNVGTIGHVDHGKTTLTAAITMVLAEKMGGGDVKLITGLGALVGYPFILQILFHSILVGGSIAVVKLIWRGEFIKSFVRIFRSFFSLILPWKTFVPIPEEDAHKIPYGCAIVLGTIWALFMDWSIR